MAGDFDGSNFVRIDDKAFGNGTGDTTTRPLDTYAENRLDSNTRLLADERVSQFSRNFLTEGDTSDRRRFTSVDGSALVWAFIPTAQAIDEITCLLHAKVDVDSVDVSGEVEWTLALGSLQPGGNGRFKRVFETSSKQSESGGVDAHRLSLDLSGEQVPEPGAYLLLEMKSTNDIKITTSKTIAGSIFQLDLTDSGNSTYDGDHDETVVTVKTNQFSEDEVFFAFHESSAGDAGVLPAITLSPISDESGVTIDRKELSFAEIRSATFDIRWDTANKASPVDPKDAATMRPQNPVIGRHASAHGSNLDAVRERERILEVGPKGEFGEGNDWPTDQHRQWSWINATSVSEPELLDRQSISLSIDEGDVIVRGLLAGFSDIVPQRHFVADPQEYLQKGRADGDVNVKVTVNQKSGGTTSQINQTTETITQMPFWLLAPSPYYYLPNVVYWSRKNADSNNEFGYVFRDGQLWRNDLPLLTPFRIEVPITTDAEGGSITRGDPVSVDLEFDGFSSTPSRSEDSQFTGSTFHMLCLSTTYSEGATP